MIDAELLRRYEVAFGTTFNAALWERRPGDTVNGMMRAALAGGGPPVTDARIAAELQGRIAPPESS